MPSNHILINNAIECFVADSKMEELMQYLRQSAYGWREKHADRPLVSKVPNETTSCIQTAS